jgi:hypothetical protein
MDCARVVFSGHAIMRMFERGIGPDAVLAVVGGGETIAEYPEDRPYGSELLLAFVNARPLHAVVAIDRSSATCIVITAYEPMAEQWEADFRTRKPE